MAGTASDRAAQEGSAPRGQFCELEGRRAIIGKYLLAIGGGRAEGPLNGLRQIGFAERFLQHHRSGFEPLDRRSVAAYEYMRNRPEPLYLRDGGDAVASIAQTS